MINKATWNFNVCLDSILNTLLYSDIFSFPLDKNELWYYLKSSRRITRRQFNNCLKQLPDGIVNLKGYYSLKKNSGIINKRIKRFSINKNKVEIAKKTANRLSFIPTVKFIGISGSLASGNADNNDDIDLFIITKKNTLWLSRLFCILVLEITGVRRRRSSVHFNNRICLNMLVDEAQLQFSTSRHDLYTAHEIAQLIPLIDNDNTYRKFITSNEWVRIFMPNVLGIALKKKNNLLVNTTSKNRIVKFVSTVLFYFFANPVIEYIVRSIQFYKISKNRTTEIVDNSLAAFHPKDHRLRVLQIYKEKLKGKNLTNKLVFTNRLWYYFNMAKTIKSLLTFLLILYFFTPGFTFAQITPSPAILPTCMPSQLNPSGCIPTNVEDFVAEYYKYGLGIVGGFAVLMIIFGSYQILVSRGNPKILNDGKTIIIYAISGLLLAIFGFVFIELIAKDILHIPGFG